MYNLELEAVSKELNDRRVEVENLKDDLEQQMIKCSELSTKLIDTEVNQGEMIDLEQ